MSARRPVLRVERHALGVRISVLGQRVHEWQLGAVVLLTLAVGALTGHVHASFAAILAALAGLWLVAKDWHDLVPARRDTAAWRVGLHRRPHPLRKVRRADPLPALAGLGAVAVAVVNVVSAVTPNVAWRGHALLAIEPLAAIRLSHALAIPAAWILGVAGPYLARRRRRALYLAIGLLLLLAVLNLLKGLDFEEAAADVGAAGLLWLGRGSFCVEHSPLARRGGALLQAAAVVATSLLVAGTAVWIGAPRDTPVATAARATGDLLVWRTPPLAFHDELARLGLAIGILGGLTLVVGASILFRPLRGPEAFPDESTRGIAVDLVRRHGWDTLAYFKLRRDKHYLFSPDRRAFLGYRIENGVLLVSGDPVGPRDALPELLRELSEYADRRGLTIAALGVSRRNRPLFEQLGLRSLYLGDEAIVDTNAFSLEGRAIRKVRQSVSRLQKAGFGATLYDVSQLDEPTLAELESVAARWRGSAPERGFSMAFDTLRCRDTQDVRVVVARDAAGRVRGFLQFVPTYGRAAMSLASMRRDRDTPNGLTEFLVVRAVELMRERGVREVSLNFAAFARVIGSPHGVAERTARAVLLLADRFFQIESLYRFNAKFFPTWEPRYFLYDGFRNLPRAGLAALRAEGQLPRLPTIAARQGPSAKPLASAEA
jgi:lysyl-tRNA synthetase class 2